MHMIKIMQRRMQSTSTSSTKGLLRREDVSLSMSGCGWLTPFHIGVVQAFKDHGLFDERTKVAGSSGGSLAGLIACSGLDQAEVRKYHLAFASHFISSRGIF
jgi:predicted acylesterase/phospholipase RssA